MIDNKKIPIYLDEKGYDKLLKSIENLKEQLKINNKGRRVAFDAGAGDGWDSPEFEEIERNEMMILGELQMKYDELSRVIIVERKEDSEIIDIDDVVRLCIIFSDDDFEERLFKLVGSRSMVETDDNIQEISVNSPIGQAIYRKRIGENSHYLVNNMQVNVLIKEKIDLLEQTVKDAVTKKLKK